MTEKKLRKGFYLFAILFTLLLCFTPIIFAFGVRHGERAAEEWETTKEHHWLEVQGYNYCPYCGEQIKEIKE